MVYGRSAYWFDYWHPTLSHTLAATQVRVAVEQRTYLALLPPGEQLVGIPDVLISGPGRPGGSAGVVLAPNAPLIGELPQPEMVRERYLEVRNVATQEVVTVIEILSPTNKIRAEAMPNMNKSVLKY